MRKRFHFLIFILASIWPASASEANKGVKSFVGKFVGCNLHDRETLRPPAGGKGTRRLGDQTGVSTIWYAQRVLASTELSSRKFASSLSWKRVSGLRA
jgi:hypothetical protein